MAGIHRAAIPGIWWYNCKVIRIMDKEFLEAFGKVIREEISRKNEVIVEGIGSFQIEHCKQYQKQYDNGRVVMMPPKDVISFSPETKKEI